MCRSSPRTWHLLASKLRTELVAIGGNLTRRNSTYDSIMPSIDLYPAIQQFCIEHKEELAESMPTREIWDETKDFGAALKPFNG
jgi:hypothetical protein